MMDDSLKSCVGDKLRELRAKHPGMSRDQKLAIALSECGDGRKMSEDEIAGYMPELVALAATVENASKAEFRDYTYNGVSVQATGRRSSSRDDKKYERTVKVDGKEYLVHYGDPDMEMQRDNPERRAAFLERHSCSTKKDPLAPGFWACLDWERVDEGKSAKSAAPSPDTLTATDRERWQATYDAVYAETGDSTKAELAAWGAVRKAYILRMAGKSAKGGAIVGGWGMMFTDETATDLDDQFFDEETRLLLDYYENAPLWMEHGQSPEYGSTPIGKRVSVKVYPHGVWVEHELDSEHPLYEQTLKGIEDGTYSYSSDSIGHYVRDGYEPETGRLGVWPVAGWSLTENPAEPGLGAVTMREFAQSVKSAQQARDAQLSGNDNAATKTKEKGRSMDEIVNGLAEFLGIEADIDAVKSSLDDLIGKMSGMNPEEDMPEEQKAGMPDMAQLAAALGLPPEADAQMLAQRLQELLAMLQPQGEPEAMESAGVPVPGKSFNFTALSAAFEAAAKSAPALPSDLPSHTQNGGRAPGMKNVNINRGAAKPTLTGMISDIIAGKAQSTQIGATGGYVVREELSSELLPQLLEANWLQQAGVRMYPMEGLQTLDIPKVTSGASAYWVGESQEITDSEMGFDVVKLVPKTVAARIIIPNQFLSRNNVNYESQARQDITYRINRAIENAALFGTGGVTSGNNGAQPRGLLYTTGVTNTSLGTNGAVPELDDLTAMEYRLRADNVESSDTWRFVFHPRTKKTFQDLTDTTGNPLIRQSWRDGEGASLIGHPFKDTTLVPITETVGSSSDCSYIVLGDWQYLAMGMSNQIEIAVNPYRLQHQLQTEIIAYTYVDVAVLYPEAFEIVSGVRA